MLSSLKLTEMLTPAPPEAVCGESGLMGKSMSHTTLPITTVSIVFLIMEQANAKLCTVFMPGGQQFIFTLTCYYNISICIKSNDFHTLPFDTN